MMVIARRTENCKADGHLFMEWPSCNASSDIPTFFQHHPLLQNRKLGANMLLYIDPVTMPKTKAEFNIPLRCSLCPKHPQFSDISHLLTHISSKSHLSHRFKLQIRAQSEIASKEQLDDFDHWYTHNNLDVMLSERMAAKELKKTTKERKSRLSSAPVSFTSLTFDIH
jgi:hypothetical protein